MIIRVHYHSGLENALDLSIISTSHIYASMFRLPAMMYLNLAFSRVPKYANISG